MSFFSKLFGLRLVCPLCHVPEAKDGFGRPRCRNPRCRHYDQLWAWQTKGLGSVHPEQAEALVLEHTQVIRRPKDTTPVPVVVGHVPSQFQDPVDLQYENFRGESRLFVADRVTCHDRGAFVSVAVAPTGRRITLRKTKIKNYADLLEDRT